MARIRQATAQATAEAVSSVFGTAELLENILLFLPPRQLLRVQRVSKPWRDCFKGSIKARGALYLQPVSSSTVYFKQDPDYAGDVQNPESGDWMTVEKSEQRVYPSLNPIARELFLINFNVHRPFVHHGLTSAKYEPYRNKRPIGSVRSGPQSEQQFEALNRSEASWRKTFITQPPCSRLEVICSRGGVLTVSAENGLTFQHVVDQLDSHLVEHKECPTIYHVIGCWDFCGMLNSSLNVVERMTDARELLRIMDDIHSKTPADLQIPDDNEAKEGSGYCQV